MQRTTSTDDVFAHHCFIFDVELVADGARVGMETFDHLNLCTIT